MGINSSLFPQISFEKKLLLRHELNLSKEDFILIYVAEFSQRKNQKFLLDSLSKLVTDNFTNIKLLLLGDGALLEDSKQYVRQLEISNNVIFTGYTKNTSIYYQASDICVSSSRSEGLPFNIMEAMSIGLPIVASKVKGHTDLVIPNKNGFLFDYDNINEFCNAIITLYKNRQLYTQCSLESTYLSKKYSLDAVLSNTVNIICDEYKARL
jgi:glycosyltransferase EpsD